VAAAAVRLLASILTRIPGEDRWSAAAPLLAEGACRMRSIRMPALEAESVLHWSSRTAADALAMSGAGSDAAFGLLGRLRMPAEP